MAAVSDQAALLFTWIQAHTDDYGRIEGGADDVLFSVVPRRGWSEDKVEEYLKELWDADLLKKYHDETGKRYVEVVGFEEHQTFRSDRGRKAHCPLPNAYDDTWDTKVSRRVKTDGEVKVSTSKGEVKIKRSRSADTQKVSADAPEKVESEPVPVMTPTERARAFFEGVNALQNKQEVPWLQEFLNAIAQKNTKVNKQSIWSEIKAFTSYWTELNGTGKKQRWEMQKTFEVERRLTTWFNRAGFKGFSSSGFGSGNSKGKAIIGLDDTENE